MIAKPIFVFTLLIGALSFGQTQKIPLGVPAQRNPQLYAANANAQEEIREATAAAIKPGKRILLVFGANWCGDCHALDNAFHRPTIAPLLNGNFVVVHVDVGEYTKNLDLAEKYHVDLKKGVPSIAVLNSDGSFLYSTSEFEKARVLSEEDVIEFLNKWKPQHASARK